MKRHTYPFLSEILISLFFSPFLWSQNDTFTNSLNLNDEIKTNHFSHRIGIEFRHAYILPTNSFLKEMNHSGYPINNAFSGHLKYSFALPESSLGSTIFAATYQGIGMSYYHFKNGREIGKPILAYLFQRSKIAHLTSHLTVDYEWNFGISAGWRPYDYFTNPNNVIIGSRLNAYLNLGLYLDCRTDQRLSFTGATDVTHFSNGNTEYPNAGLNTIGYKLGIIYNVSSEPGIHRPNVDPEIFKFPR